MYYGIVEPGLRGLSRSRGMLLILYASGCVVGVGGDPSMLHAPLPTSAVAEA